MDADDLLRALDRAVSVARASAAHPRSGDSATACPASDEEDQD